MIGGGQTAFAKFKVRRSSRFIFLTQQVLRKPLISFDMCADYVKATVKVLFIEGRLSVWKYQLNELQGKLETVPQFLDWWNECTLSTLNLISFLN